MFHIMMITESVCLLYSLYPVNKTFVLSLHNFLDMFISDHEALITCFDCFKFNDIYFSVVINFFIRFFKNFFSTFKYMYKFYW